VSQSEAVEPALKTSGDKIGRPWAMAELSILELRGRV